MRSGGCASARRTGNAYPGHVTWAEPRDQRRVTKAQRSGRRKYWGRQSLSVDAYADKLGVLRGQEVLFICYLFIYLFVCLFIYYYAAGINIRTLHTVKC